MAVYRYTNESITPVKTATFSDLGITERSDLQRLLRDRIDIVAPSALVISEEFGQWEDSKRRIDLLAIDKAANLIVIELKRTEDGGHMELQALRYAAMVSTITFDQAVDVFERYLKHRSDERNAEETILQFLEWEEPQEDGFGGDVQIVLASAEFSKELTTTVLWLRERNIDIRCVRIQPYGSKDDTLLDVQQVVPLPEAEDYQIRVRNKNEKERVARQSSKDYTKYRVTVNGQVFNNLAKRWTIYHLVHALVDAGVNPSVLQQQITWRYLFFESEGIVNSEVMNAAIAMKYDTPNSTSRWFSAQDELIFHDGKTYAISNQWGKRTQEAIDRLLSTTDSHQISVKAVN